MSSKQAIQTLLDTGRQAWIPRDDEWRRRLIVWSDGEQLSDVELSGDANFWARVDLMHTHGTFVAEGRHYAPGLPMTRFGPFAVVNGLVRVVIERIDAIENLPTTPTPTRIAPAFSMLLEPALDLREAPREIAEAADQIVQRMQFVNEADAADSN